MSIFNFTNKQDILRKFQKIHNWRQGYTIGFVVLFNNNKKNQQHKTEINLKTKID